MVVVAIRDLMFRSKVQEAAARLGVPLRFAPRAGALDEAVRDAGGGTLLVDLTQPGFLAGVVAAKRAAPVHVVGFLGHLQVDLMDEASAAGVDEVLPRGELVRRLDAVLLRPG